VGGGRCARDGSDDACGDGGGFAIGDKGEELGCPALCGLGLYGGEEAVGEEL